MTNLTTEEMQRIVDGAPEGATHVEHTGLHLTAYLFMSRGNGSHKIWANEKWVLSDSRRMEQCWPIHALDDLRTILAQQQEIERLRNPWVSVEDELPKDDQDILMMDETGKRFSGRGRVLKATNNFKNTPTVRHTKYTHWMPLPQPSKGESDEK